MAIPFIDFTLFQCGENLRLKFTWSKPSSARQRNTDDSNDALKVSEQCDQYLHLSDCSIRQVDSLR